MAVSKEVSTFLKKLLVFTIFLVLIVFAVFYPYRSDSKRLFYITKNPRIFSNFANIVLQLITEGGGNVPNCIVILFYAAMKD